MGTIVRTLLEAYRLYGKQEFLKAARKGGDFLILAQMPDPQPAWAQQYNFQMEPAWARWFEPPAIVSAESVDVVQTLIELYLVTGDNRYLRPVPKALDWFKRSQLPNGLWARFYELKTNRPLYVNKRGELVYTPEDLREGYAFEGSFGAIVALSRIAQAACNRPPILPHHTRKLLCREHRQRTCPLRPELPPHDR
jgi:hypothetical protein